ncbi:COG3650 family protein [Maritimibacter fusiformis]|uniref:Peptide-binding protein n=1 Tax=Maritimibacter fusiformis TaxID=2603819 RepID=A0A5D0R9Y5_9RHOB|nr:peptide-binding protein [Maritimibacter fusiformis]TYB77695.1 peptide-binding protein [Maritimibacter fusiformis]
MKTLLALILLVLPFGAMAQPYPALHDVTGVAGDDVLNIRAGPSASTEIIGTFGPFQRNIEVVALNSAGTWGLVNTAEGSGWASMRFLARQPGQAWGDMPDALECGGTEPFWSLSIRADGTVRLDRMGEVDFYITRARIPASGRPDRFAIRADSGGGEITPIIAYAACSDGMSDRTYGLTVDFLHRTATGETLYSGCCSLAP